MEFEEKEGASSGEQGCCWFEEEGSEKGVGGE